MSLPQTRYNSNSIQLQIEKCLPLPTVTAWLSERVRVWNRVGRGLEGYCGGGFGRKCGNY